LILWLHVKIIWGTEFDWKDIDFGVFDLLGLLLYGKFMQVVVVLYIYTHTRTDIGITPTIKALGILLF
jgi:hypothetical protein